MEIKEFHDLATMTFNTLTEAEREWLKANRGDPVAGDLIEAALTQAVAKFGQFVVLFKTNPEVRKAFCGMVKQGLGA